MPNPSDSSPIAWWESLKHGGMLIAPARVAVAFADAADPLSYWYADRLRREIVRAENQKSDLSDLLDVVLEQVCGFTVGWFKGTRVGSEWSTRTPAGENIKPRRVWQHEGGTLPVFVDEEPRLGIGRGRRSVARVIEWLRARSLNLALLTNGRQWRLIYAGIDHDAFSEWDTQLWFAEGEPGLQVDALRRLIAPAAWKAPPPVHGETKHCPLLQAILDSRKGQNELSAVLGERVRQAVELLIRSHGPALDRLTAQTDGGLPGPPPVDGRDIYAAAVRTVMRMVVLMFAESRLLMPMDRSPLYFNSYSLAGLRESLESAHARGPALLHSRRSAWPRVLALFALVRDGCGYPDLSVPKYGGDLFTTGPTSGGGDPNSGMSRALAVFESACFQSDFAGVMSDADVRDILEKLSYSEMTIRQGRAGGGSIRTRVPVDFSDLQSEYIGILYEGLLDFELRRAGPDEPIVFLAIGDEPALPLSRLEAMDDAAIKNLVEKFKVKGGTEEEEAGEDADDAEADAEDDEATADEPLLAGDVPEVDPAAEAATTDASGQDPIQQARERAWTWARRAVSVGGMVRRPKTKKAEAIAQYEREVEAAGRKLVRTAILPGQWYLVRWGGTRKGSGTFYTRPQLSVPTVHRTLRPLAYIAPVDNPDAPTAAWTPKKPEEILALKVCDPAVGSGSFPVAALRFLTDALYRSLEHHGRLRDEGNKTVIALAEGRESAGRLDEDLLPCRPTDADFEPRLKARLRRYVVERCLYGVDLDPLAIELAKIALWIETMDRELPFSFLDHKFKCGNALVGCWFDRFRHYPIMAWLREGGDKSHTTGVNYPKEARTKAIAKHLKDVIKPDLVAMIDRMRGQGDLFTAEGKTAEQVHDEALSILEKMHALPPGEDGEHQRATLHRQLRESPAYVALKRAFDCWCALWFWPADQLAAAPRPSTFTALSPEAIEVAERIARERRFFHWELEFPDVFAAKTGVGGLGLGAGGKTEGTPDANPSASSPIPNPQPPIPGFHAIIGNPPWDTLQPNSKEWFSNVDPLFRTYGKQDALARQKEYFAADAKVEKEWLEFIAFFKDIANFVKAGASPFGDQITTDDEGKQTHDFPLGERGRASLDSSKARHSAWAKRRAVDVGYADPEHPFALQGDGKPYTYKLFTELALSLLKTDGRLGFVVPSGLYTDHGSTQLRARLLGKCRWEWLFGFENRDGIFDIHRSFKFNPVLIVKGGQTAVIRTAFMQRDPDDWALGIAEALTVPYARAQVERFSPRSKAILEIRSARDLAVLEKIYANSVLLGDSGPEGWGIRYAQGDFNMTSDSALFPPRPKWEERGYRPDEYSRWIRGGWRPIGELWASMGVGGWGLGIGGKKEAGAARDESAVQSVSSQSPTPNPQSPNDGFVVPGSGSVAEGDGSGGQRVSGDEGDAKGGDVRTDLADAAGGGVDPIEHRRGARTTDDRGVSESTLRRTGFAHGTQHPTGDHAASGDAHAAGAGAGSVAGRHDGTPAQRAHDGARTPVVKGAGGWGLGVGDKAPSSQPQSPTPKPQPPPYASLPLPRADLPPGVILSRDMTAFIREEAIDWEVETVDDGNGGEVEVRHRAVALPLYQGKMIWQMDFAASVATGLAGKNAWAPGNWANKQIAGPNLIGAWRARGGRPTRVVFRDVQNATNQRTFIGALAPAWPAGNTVPVLTAPRSAGAGSDAAILASLVSFPADRVLRSKMSQNHVNWFYAQELPVARSLASASGEAVSRAVAALSAAGVWFAPLWLATAATAEASAAGWRGHFALSPHERLRLRCIVDAAVAALYGLDLDDLKWILKDCDHPAADVTNKAFARRLDPKGFWRVDKHEPPERRHTVLTLAAFADLSALITAVTAAGGTRDDAIAAFCGLGPAGDDENPAGAESARGGPGSGQSTPGTCAGAPGTDHSLPGERAASLQPGRTTLQTARTTVQPSRTTVRMSRTTLQLIRNILQTSRTMFQTDRTTLQPTRTAVQPLRTLARIDPAEGWMLPETLRLADLGLGHDARATEPQPVAAALGQRFYDWQLAQDAAESWRECALHARNLLGAEGFEKLQAELEGREVDPPSSSPTPNPKSPTPKRPDPPTLFG